jgi:hypothetical protein
MFAMADVKLAIELEGEGFVPDATDARGKWGAVYLTKRTISDGLYTLGGQLVVRLHSRRRFRSFAVPQSSRPLRTAVRTLSTLRRAVGGDGA